MKKFCGFSEKVPAGDEEAVAEAGLCAVIDLAITLLRHGLIEIDQSEEVHLGEGRETSDDNVVLRATLDPAKLINWEPSP